MSPAVGQPPAQPERRGLRVFLQEVAWRSTGHAGPRARRAAAQAVCEREAVRVCLATMQQQVPPELAALAPRRHVELRKAQLDIDIVCRRHDLRRAQADGDCGRVVASRRLHHVVSNPDRLFTACLCCRRPLSLRQRGIYTKCSLVQRKENRPARRTERAWPPKHTPTQTWTNIQTCRKRSGPGSLLSHEKSAQAQGVVILDRHTQCQDGP